MARKRTAIVVLQERTVTVALGQGVVGGLFDFVMLLPPDQLRNRHGHVRCTSLRSQRVGRGLVWSGASTAAGSSRSSLFDRVSWSHVPLHLSALYSAISCSTQTTFAGVRHAASAYCKGRMADVLP